MVEVYTDKELKLDSLLCYKPMHSAFKDFMQAEKSTGPLILRVKIFENL